MALELRGTPRRCVKETNPSTHVAWWASKQPSAQVPRMNSLKQTSCYTLTCGVQDHVSGGRDKGGFWKQKCCVPFAMASFYSPPHHESSGLLSPDALIEDAEEVPLERCGSLAALGGGRRAPKNTVSHGRSVDRTRTDTFHFLSGCHRLNSYVYTKVTVHHDAF